MACKLAARYRLVGSGFGWRGRNRAGRRRPCRQTRARNGAENRRPAEDDSV